jgi:hypothetical protein
MKRPAGDISAGLLLKDEQNMNSGKYLIVSIVGGSLFFGPPAAELISENDKGRHAAVLPGGAHEHPVEEHDTQHVGASYTMVFTSSGTTLTNRWF